MAGHTTETLLEKYLSQRDELPLLPSTLFSLSSVYDLKLQFVALKIQSLSAPSKQMCSLYRHFFLNHPGVLNLS